MRQWIVEELGEDAASKAKPARISFASIVAALLGSHYMTKI